MVALKESTESAIDLLRNINKTADLAPKNVCMSVLANV
jgi:hypothetical protein